MEKVLKCYWTTGYRPVGSERLRQLDISSKEISDVISSSKQIFSDMMRITVSEQEDARIWRAYDTVDEKKILS